MLAIGLVLAFILKSPDTWTEHPRSDALKAELAKDAPDMEKIIMLLSRGAARDVYAEDGAAWIDASRLSISDKSVLVALWESLTHWPLEPSADLLFYAHCVQPLRHANELVGNLYLGTTQKDEAITYFEREAKNADATGARQKTLQFAARKTRLRRSPQDRGRSHDRTAPHASQPRDARGR